MDHSIGQFILYMVALIFSLSVHESAHAWMSNRFGDDLARLQGRISLNPVSHVDPIGTTREILLAAEVDHLRSQHTCVRSTPTRSMSEEVRGVLVDTSG